MFQIMIFPSMPPLINYLSSWLNWIVLMQLEWPYSSEISFAVFKSQILIIYSLPPVAFCIMTYNIYYEKSAIVRNCQWIYFITVFLICWRVNLVYRIRLFQIPIRYFSILTSGQYHLLIFYHIKWIYC
jgi:hypothetical protein